LIEAIIFDMDGTLIHLPIDYDKLFEEFSKIMKTENIRPVTRTISKLDGKTKTKIFQIWDKTELAILTRITTIEEGISLYNRFAEKPKALVTMQGKAFVNRVLEQLGLTFDAIITRENGLDRTKQLKTAAQILGVKCENSLFVGNEETDQLAAKKAGCQFLRVKG
jgi:HAD superfamily hydrolase (TIGR01549 family)